MRANSKKVTLVVVHAESSDVPSWEKVTGDLEQLGHQVVVARIPLISFNHDVDSIRRLVQRQDGHVILAARSYVGAVMTAAAAGDKKIQGLVYAPPNAPNGKESTRKVSLPCRDSTLRLGAHEIDWVFAEDNYARIHRGKKSLLVRSSLSKLEKMFHGELVRVHRSYMVNIDRVREVRRAKNHYQIVLSDGTTVNCSRRYKRRLRLALDL